MYPGAMRDEVDELVEAARALLSWKRERDHDDPAQRPTRTG